MEYLLCSKMLGKRSPPTEPSHVSMKSEASMNYPLLFRDAPLTACR